MPVDDTPVPAGQAAKRWQDEPRRPGPWRDYLDDPANLDYAADYTPRPAARGYRPGYGDHATGPGPRGYRPGYGGRTGGPQAAGPPWGEQPRPPMPGRHAAMRGGPHRATQDPPVPAVMPGLTQRIRAAARNHTGAAALTAAAVVGSGVGAGMFGFAPFASPAATAPSANAALPAAAPPMATTAGSSVPVRHHTAYTGKHRKSEPRPAAPGTHRLDGSAGSAAAAGPSPGAQSTGSGGSAPAGSSSPAPSSPAPSSPAPSSPAPSTSPAPAPGGSSGSGHSGGHSGHGQGGNGGLLGGVTGLLGGLGL